MSARVVALVVVAACAPAWKSTPHDRLFQTDVADPHAAPPERATGGDWWEHGGNSVVRPLGRLVSPARYVSVVTGGRRAYDVNAFGQVPDSGWFENRVAKRAVAMDEILRPGEWIAEGPLRIVNGKVSGASAGFVVDDTAGTRWFVKFDPPAHPDLSTSAEVIASRLLWLAGYHVPDVVVADIRVDRFQLAPTATTRDRYNRRVPLTQAGLDRLFVLLNPDRDGAVRALFSRQPPGTVIGSFAYRDLEPDDPLDNLPHEHRRSLRGLRVFFAWLGNSDARASNTLDVFRPTGRDGSGHVVHYLIDFGDSFGSAGTKEKAASQGWRYLADWGEIFRDLISLGFRYPRWLKTRRSPFRSVGPFESELFDLDRWKPDFQNAAFDEATHDDELWAASILARVQPAHIEAAVATGRYRESGASGYVVEVLKERRRKILLRTFSRAVALDRPRAVNEGRAIELDDLRALGGIGREVPLAYEVRWNRTRRGDVVVDKGVSQSTTIDLASALTRFAALPGSDADPFLTIRVGPAADRRNLEIHLRVTPQGRVIPVALER